MATPFDSTPAPADAEVKLATEAQLIRAIQPMLADRKWQNAPEAYSARCAAIKTIIDLLTNGTQPTALGVPLTGDVAADFAIVMAACVKTADEADARIWKPLTRKGASALIDWLGNLEFAGAVSVVEEANVVKATAVAVEARTARVSAGLPSAEIVPAGRYAVATEDGAVNALAFYKVDRPTEGKWAGYVFVKLVVSDDEQRLSKATSAAVLAKIAAVGAEAASAAYGHEIGACGVCGRTLTNDESRERGIGPVCADKMGW